MIQGGGFNGTLAFIRVDDVMMMRDKLDGGSGVSGQMVDGEELC